MAVEKNCHGSIAQKRTAERHAAAAFAVSHHRQTNVRNGRSMTHAMPTTVCFVAILSTAMSESGNSLVNNANLVSKFISASRHSGHSVIVILWIF